MSAPATALLKALLAVQAESPTLPKDKTNPHFGSRFTGLDTIVETLGPILNKHGLVWVALPGYNEDSGAPELAYQLVHAESGERIHGKMPLLLGGKADSQALGSALTYTRRYALVSVLNLVADDDDDGNAGAAAAGEQRPAAKPRSSGGRKPSEKQLAFLKKVLNGQAHGLTAPTGAQLGLLGFDVQAGWTDKLTGAQVSDLLDRAKDGNWPADPGPPASDVPSDFDPGPSEPVGEELPFS